MLNLGSDSVKRLYRHLPADLRDELKMLVKSENDKRITLSVCPMPGSRGSFRVSVTFKAHSWAASLELMNNFYNKLEVEVWRRLDLYRENP